MSDGECQGRRSPRHAAAVSLFLLFMLCLALNGMMAEGAGLGCHGIELTGHGVSAADVVLACEGIARAKAFFNRHRLALPSEVSLHLHQEGIAKDDNHIGTFNAADNRIDLLSFTRARTLGKVFRAPMNRSLYRGFVVHELAHAVADRYFSAQAASRLGHEYIAYVAQLASLPAEELQGVLARYQLEGFRTTQEITLLYYQLNPCAFGVKVFLHYRGQAHPREFIRQLLRGMAGLSPEPGTR